MGERAFWQQKKTFQRHTKNVVKSTWNIHISFESSSPDNPMAGLESQDIEELFVSHSFNELWKRWDSQIENHAMKLSFRCLELHKTQTISW